MSCELTPDLKRSPAYNAHAASIRPNTKLLFKRSLDQLVSLTVVEIAYRICTKQI